MIYTLVKDATVMGQDPKWGYSYWGEVSESDFPVMFSTHTANFMTGQQLTAEEQEKKTSKKGTEYLMLKKVKKVNGTQEEPTPSQESQVASPAVDTSFTGKDRIMLTSMSIMLKDNNQMLKQLTGVVQDDPFLNLDEGDEEPPAYD